MFFLLRVAFWLGVVILLLPTGQSQKDDGAAASGAADAFGAAAAALADMRGFCSRQPEACTVGAQAAHAFGQKAQASAKLVYEFITEKVAKEPATEAAAAASAENTSQSTLSPSDREAPWRGPRPVEVAGGPV
jgi:hypothetical protein